MKPENIWLHRDGGQIIVKLGDLGLAERSTNRTSDITRFGMTTFCMATGEKYGARRFLPESIKEFTGEVESAVAECNDGSALGKALGNLPGLLDSIFHEKITMAEVRDTVWLHSFQFRDDGAADKIQKTTS